MVKKDDYRELRRKTVFLLCSTGEVLEGVVIDIDHKQGITVIESETGKKAICLNIKANYSRSCNASYDDMFNYTVLALGMGIASFENFENEFVNMNYRTCKLSTCAFQ